MVRSTVHRMEMISNRVNNVHHQQFARLTAIENGGLGNLVNRRGALALQRRELIQ